MLYEPGGEKVIGLLTQVGSNVFGLVGSMHVKGCFQLLVVAALAGCGSDTAKEQRDSYKIFTPLKANQNLSPYGYMSAYIAKTAKLGGSSLELKESDGSFDSLLKLEKSTRSLAIVQADVLYHYLKGGHPQFPSPKTESRVRAIARLFPEWLILTKHNEKQRTSTDTSEQEVLVTEKAFGGAEGSGSLVTSINVARVLLPNWRFNLHRHTEQQQKNTIELAVQSPPAMGANRLSPKESSRFLFLSPSSAEILANAFRGVYRPVRCETLQTRLGVELPGRQTATIAVDAILVGTKDLSGSHIEAVLAALRDISGKPSGKTQPIKAPRCISPMDLDKLPVTKAHILTYTSYLDGARSNGRDENRSKNLPVATHPHIRLKLSVPDKDFISLFLAWLFGKPPLPVLVGLLVLSALLYKACRSRAGRSLLMAAVRAGLKVWTWFVDLVSRGSIGRWNWGKRTVELLRRHPHKVALVIAFVASHFLVGTCVWLLEFHADTLKPETDLAVGGVFNATWALIRMMTMGVSLPVRSDWSLVCIAVLKGGYALAAALFVWGCGVSLRDWATHMKTDVIIIGWNEKGPLVRRELEETGKLAGVEKSLKIVVFESKTSVTIDRQFSGTPHIVTESLEEGMKKAGYGKAPVIVLADPNAAELAGDEDVDLWVINTLRAMHEYEQRNGIDPPHVVAQIVKHRSRRTAMAARENTEVICVDAFGTELLAQSTDRHWLSRVFDELLTTDEATNEVYFEGLSADEKRLSFAQLSGLRLEKGMIAIGYQNDVDGRIVINPKDHDPEKDPPAKLIVITRKPERR